MFRALSVLLIAACVLQSAAAGNLRSEPSDSARERCVAMCDDAMLDSHTEVHSALRDARVDTCVDFYYVHPRPTIRKVCRKAFDKTMVAAACKLACTDTRQLCNMPSPYQELFFVKDVDEIAKVGDALCARDRLELPRPARGHACDSGLVGAAKFGCKLGARILEASPRFGVSTHSPDSNVELLMSRF